MATSVSYEVQNEQWNKTKKVGKCALWQYFLDGSHSIYKFQSDESVKKGRLSGNNEPTLHERNRPYIVMMGNTCEGNMGDQNFFQYSSDRFYICYVFAFLYLLVVWRYLINLQKKFSSLKFVPKLYDSGCNCSAALHRLQLLLVFKLMYFCSTLCSRPKFPSNLWV